MTAWQPSAAGLSVRLLTLRNTDGVPLDAVAWEPSDRPLAGIVYLHSKGGNFYTGPGRFVPELTRDRPLLQLAINMRCHDIATTRLDVPSDDIFSDRETYRGAEVDGGAYERIADGHKDVAAAVSWMRGRGVEQVFIAGHSSGGFYVGQYAALHDDVAGRILISPLTSNRTALGFWFDSDGERDATVERAKRMVEAGQGELLLTVRHWYYAISARSFLERATEPPDVWEKAMAASDVPTLWLWGGEESRHQLWERLCAQLRGDRDRRVVIPGAEHHFIGHEQAVADEILDFVTANTAAPAR
jgi:pimeloyl-ACP methyl ester carboxylesterase